MVTAMRSSVRVCMFVMGILSAWPHLPTLLLLPPPPPGAEPPPSATSAARRHVSHLDAAACSGGLMLDRFGLGLGSYRSMYQANSSRRRSRSCRRWSASSAHSVWQPHSPHTIEGGGVKPKGVGGCGGRAGGGRHWNESLARASRQRRRRRWSCCSCASMCIRCACCCPSFSHSGLSSLRRAQVRAAKVGPAPAAPGRRGRPCSRSRRSWSSRPSWRSLRDALL